MSEFLLQKGKNWTTALRIKYDSYTVFYYKERLVYDIYAIIAAVGGSLGLFLGLSCYNIGTRLIEKIAISVK